MHYFKFNIGEYASHTRHLSPIEDIAYRRLLDLAYTTELPLINDIRQLTRLINMREYAVEVQDVLSEFFFESDDGWLNNRVIKEIKATGEKSDAAKNSAAIRWDNERKAKKMQKECDEHANASYENANASINDATNNPLPITNNPIEQTISKTAKNPQFFSGINPQVVSDYLAVRKAKKAAAMSQTAFDGLQRESLKAGVSIEQALIVCCERNWVSFKAEWVERRVNREDAQQAAAKSIFKQEFIDEQTHYFDESEQAYAKLN